MDPLDLQRLTTIFNLCDTDGSGTLGLDEVELGLAVLKLPDIKAEFIDGFMDGGGRALQYADFITVFSRRVSISAGGMGSRIDRRLNNMIDLREVFDELDTDGSGVLEANEISAMFASLGLDLDAAGEAKLMAQLDVDGKADSVISWVEMMMACASGKLAELGLASTFGLVETDVSTSEAEPEGSGGDGGGSSGGLRRQKSQRQKSRRKKMSASGEAVATSGPASRRKEPSGRRLKTNRQPSSNRMGGQSTRSGGAGATDITAQDDVAVAAELPLGAKNVRGRRLNQAARSRLGSSVGLDGPVQGEGAGGSAVGVAAATSPPRVPIVAAAPRASGAARSGKRRLPSMMSPHFTPMELHACETAFARLDRNDDGVLSAPEVAQAVSDMAVHGTDRTGFDPALLLDVIQRRGAAIDWATFLGFILEARIAATGSDGGGAAFRLHSEAEKGSLLGGVPRGGDSGDGGAEEGARSSCPSQVPISLSAVLHVGKYTARLRYAQRDVQLLRVPGQALGLALELKMDLQLATVSDVHGGSTADGHGIKVGDILMAVNGRSLHGMQLRFVMFTLGAPELCLTFFREKESSMRSGLGGQLMGEDLAAVIAQKATAEEQAETAMAEGCEDAEDEMSPQRPLPPPGVAAGRSGKARHPSAHPMQERVRRLTQPLVALDAAALAGGSRDSRAGRVKARCTTPEHEAGGLSYGSREEQIARAFSLLDAHGEGRADSESVSLVMRLLGLLDFAASLFRVLDADGDGFVHETEFGVAMASALELGYFDEFELAVAMGVDDQTSSRSVRGSDVDDDVADEQKSAGGGGGSEQKGLGALSPAQLLRRLTELDTSWGVFERFDEQNCGVVAARCGRPMLAQLLRAGTITEAERATLLACFSPGVRRLRPSLGGTVSPGGHTTDRPLGAAPSVAAVERAAARWPIDFSFSWPEFAEAVCCRRRFGGPDAMISLRRAFHLFDTNKDGFLSPPEVCLCLAVLHASGPNVAAPNAEAADRRVVDETALAAAFATLDVDGDGLVSLFEFTNGLSRCMLPSAAQRDGGVSPSSASQLAGDRKKSTMLGMHVAGRHDGACSPGFFVSQRETRFVPGDDAASTAPLLALTKDQVAGAVDLFEHAWSAFETHARESHQLVRSDAADAVAELTNAGQLTGNQAARSLRALLGGKDTSSFDTSAGHVEFDPDGHMLPEHATWAEFVAAVFNITVSGSGGAPVSGSTTPPPVAFAKPSLVSQQSMLLDDHDMPIDGGAASLSATPPLPTATSMAGSSAVAHIGEHLLHKTIPNSPCKATFVPTAEDRRSSGRKVSYTKQAADDEKAAVLSQCLTDPVCLVGWMVELPHFGTGEIVSHKRERTGMKAHNLYTIKFDTGPVQTLSLDRHNHKDGRVSVHKVTQQKTYDKVPFVLIQRAEKLPTQVQANPMRGANAEAELLQSSKIRC